MDVQYCNAVSAQGREVTAHRTELTSQLRTVHDAAMLVLSRGELPPEAPVVGAGIGEAVLREVTRRLGRDYIPFQHLIEADPAVEVAASRVAPAAALALLAADGR
ncbi:MAG: hypothetical protein K6T87_18225 [Roseiflexus sp.]|uniref:hypothetical protein n=1 Tax=Roseiflexus sp. TaxID=2562120 RepID=UPI0025F5156A|nr:hypothetical protein [Roseiflexus sp.]MCL6542496.1 hypothetical protein [Roseiflexus sp.]